MSYKINAYPVAFKVMAVVAIVFGLLTVKSGGTVLFTQGEAHQAAGNYVPFVLWFNFMAGFAYLVGGIGLWLQRGWAGQLAKVIALLTVLVFIAFGVHIIMDGAYEARTIGAMSLRSTVWIVIAVVTYRIGQYYHGQKD